MRVNPQSCPDQRDVPRYTIADAAFFIDVPRSTVRRWCLGHGGRKRKYTSPLIKPALHDPRNPSLSFYNLAELHILAATRRVTGISLQKIRDAIDYISGSFRPGPHPLLGHEFFTDGKNLFIQRLTETVNLSRKGQLAFKQVVDVYLNRLIQDSKGLPEAIYPIRRHDTQKKPVLISSVIGSGQPITPKKGIRVSVLVNRNSAGESFKDLADDYGLTELEIKEAIRYMEAA